ncbi:CheR family methyltransferase [Alteribacillus sp. HJP-4]|uniref:CheR family methyltransferase n=1 Tax=Alteribacillus sp. HJP-4 TaxID=2775394 RepID=UPI0035CCFA0F
MKNVSEQFILDDYEVFKSGVKKKTGIDLSRYKEAQMKRRLKAFYEKRTFKSFEDFLHNGLLKNEIVLSDFLERMTINVSEFYRNPKRWEVLNKKIFPKLISRSPRLNIWSAACSTGEEPYTASIIAAEHFLSHHRILATDIDNVILKRAKAGLYTERSLKEMPKEYIEKYFVKESPGYRIKDNIKSAVTFKKHNLLADQYEKQFDLIICRNVLIYFTETAKEEVFHNFSSSLKPGGILFVGSTEQIFNPAQFGLTSADTFFYQKTE